MYAGIDGKQHISLCPLPNTIAGARTDCSTDVQTKAAALTSGQICIDLAWPLSPGIIPCGIAKSQP